MRPRGASETRHLQGDDPLLALVGGKKLKDHLDGVGGLRVAQAACAVKRAAAARGAPRTAPWRVPPAEACQSNEKNAESYDDNGGVFVAAGASLRERGRVRFCWRSHCADLIQRHALLADRAIEDQLRAPPFDLPMRVLQPRRYPDVRTSWYLSSGGVFFYNQAEPDLRKMFDFRK